jgi:hypothetical protein
MKRLEFKLQLASSQYPGTNKLKLELQHDDSVGHRNFL